MSSIIKIKVTEIEYEDDNVYAVCEVLKGHPTWAENYFQLDSTGKPLYVMDFSGIYTEPMPPSENGNERRRLPWGNKEEYEEELRDDPTTVGVGFMFIGESQTKEPEGCLAALELIGIDYVNRFVIAFFEVLTANPTWKATYQTTLGLFDFSRIPVDPISPSEDGNERFFVVWDECGKEEYERKVKDGTAFGVGQRFYTEELRHDILLHSLNRIFSDPEKAIDAIFDATIEVTKIVYDEPDVYAICEAPDEVFTWNETYYAVNSHGKVLGSVDFSGLSAEPRPKSVYGNERRRIIWDVCGKEEYERMLQAGDALDVGSKFILQNRVNEILPYAVSRRASESGYDNESFIKDAPGTTMEVTGIVYDDPFIYAVCEVMLGDPSWKGTYLLKDNGGEKLTQLKLSEACIITAANPSESGYKRCLITLDSCSREEYQRRMENDEYKNLIGTMFTVDDLWNCLYEDTDAVQILRTISEKNTVDFIKDVRAKHYKSDNLELFSKHVLRHTGFTSLSEEEQLKLFSDVQKLYTLSDYPQGSSIASELATFCYELIHKSKGIIGDFGNRISQGNDLLRYEELSKKRNFKNTLISAATGLITFLPPVESIIGKILLFVSKLLYGALTLFGAYLLFTLQILKLVGVIVVMAVILYIAEFVPEPEPLFAILLRIGLFGSAFMSLKNTIKSSKRSPANDRSAEYAADMHTILNMADIMEESITRNLEGEDKNDEVKAYFRLLRDECNDLLKKL